MGVPIRIIMLKYSGTFMPTMNMVTLLEHIIGTFCNLLNWAYVREIDCPLILNEDLENYQEKWIDFAKETQ